MLNNPSRALPSGDAQIRANNCPFGENVIAMGGIAKETSNSRYIDATRHSFISLSRLTFRQALELGGHVKKGEHGSQVVYASTFKKKETDAAGEEIEQDIPFLKTYTVFCADQCDGLPNRRACC